MRKQFIFIDESGDPGITKTGGSRYFVMAAVVFGDEEEMKKISEIFKSKKEELGWSHGMEFKFSRTKKEIIISLLKELKSLDCRIHGVVVDKTNIPHSKMHRNNIYQDTLIELLNNIKLYNANINIDGQYGKRRYRELSTYTRKSFRKGSISKIRLVDSLVSEEIQLADLVAGAIARMVSDKPDSDAYFKIIKSKTKLIIT